jgi:hypothetical protein
MHLTGKDSGRPVRERRAVALRRWNAFAVLLLIVLIGCGAITRETPDPAVDAPMTAAAIATNSPTPVVRPTPNATPVAPTTLASPIPSAELAPYRGPVGVWEGHLERPADTLQVRLALAGCVRVGDQCGTLEFIDPRQPAIALCAPSLTYRGVEGENLLFEELPAIRQYECLPMFVRLTPSGIDTFDIERFVGADHVCCRGSVTRSSDVVPVGTPPAALGVIDGFEAGARLDLGARASQFTAETAEAVYLPLISSVVAIDFATGELSEVAAYEPGPAMTVDANAVAAVNGSVWVARTQERRLERIVSTDAGPSHIMLADPPTALAADGDTLWVTSYKGSSVTRVNTLTNTVEARISVHNPIGVAVGDGAIWVGMNSDDQLVRIDPGTNSVTDTVPLGTGNGPACGMCVQNVTLGDGAVWTANNRGRSVTRVDTRTLQATEISTDLRAWAVADGGGFIWASQMEEHKGFQDFSRGGVARIDPTSFDVVQYEIPGVLSVHWHGDRLWLVVPGSRTDFLYEYVPVR